MGNILRSPTNIGNLTLSDGSIDDTLYVNGNPIRDISPDLNIGNGTINGTLTQKNLSYNQMIEDFEPNMAAYVYVKAGNTVPASAQKYLEALQNSISPTSAQLIDALTNQMASLQVIITNYKDFTGTPYEAYNAYSIDGLVKAQLDDRWGVSSSDNLGNSFGRASDGAVGLGFKNKLWSPAAVTVGFDNQAGDEGYPSESIAAFAGGFFTQAKGLQSLAFGQGNEEGNKPLCAEGETSIALGKVTSVQVSACTDGTDKISAQRFKDALYQAEVITEAQKNDDDFAFYLDGDHAGGNICKDGYIDKNAQASNVNIGPNAIVSSENHEGAGRNNFVHGWLHTVCGVDNAVFGSNNSVYDSVTNLIQGWRISVASPTVLGTGANIVSGNQHTVTDTGVSVVSGVSNIVEKASADVVMGAGLKDIHSTYVNVGQPHIRFGRYNTDDSTNIFEIGNGTADNARHNAFAITEEGYIVLPNFTSTSSTTPAGYKTFKCVNGVLTAID